MHSRQKPSKDVVVQYQHRTRYVVSRRRSGEVPHVPMLEVLHNNNRTQTLGDDCNTPIASAPPRLQRMLVKSRGYDYNVKHRPGNEMIMSDVLSRLPNPSARSEEQLDLRVDGLSLDLVNFSATNQQELCDESRRFPSLNALAEVVYHSNNGRNGSCLTWLATSLEEKRRWLVINAPAMAR